MLLACSETWLTQPQITSSMTDGSRWLRSAKARRTVADSSAGWMFASAPFRLPMGVRTASTITASRINALLASDYCRLTNNAMSITPHAPGPAQEALCHSDGRPGPEVSGRDGTTRPSRPRRPSGAPTPSDPTWMTFAPMSDDRRDSGARPHWWALLCEGTRALDRVRRRPHGLGQHGLALERLLGRPARALLQDLLRRRDGQRATGGDLGRELHGRRHRGARRDQLVDQAQTLGVDRGERLAGQRQLHRQVVGQPSG